MPAKKKNDTGTIYKAFGWKAKVKAKLAPKKKPKPKPTKSTTAKKKAAPKKQPKASAKVLGSTIARRKVKVKATNIKKHRKERKEWF